MRALHRPQFLARLAETWFRRPTTPTRVVLDVTRRCNLRCSICRTWSVTPQHELTVAEIRATMRQLPGLTWLDVTGGEPFLRADIADVLDAIVESSPTLGVLHFPTNGWFTRRVCDVVERLHGSAPHVDLIVTVSLDGPPATHDGMRGCEGSFERALETFLRLRQMKGIDVYVGTTIAPENAGAIDELHDVLRERIPGFRAREWHWNVQQISQHFFANGHRSLLREEVTSDLVRDHMRRRGGPRTLVDLMELMFLVNLQFFRRGEPSGIVCQSLRSACFISPEGDVYPCHVYDRPLGNVRDRPFEEIWGSKDVLAARRDIERLACGGCFTPCEAYPAMAGAPLQTAVQTARRTLKILRERRAPAP